MKTKCYRCQFTDVENHGDICQDCCKNLKLKYGEMGEEMVILFNRHVEFMGRWHEGENNHNKKEDQDE